MRVRKEFKLNLLLVLTVILSVSVIARPKVADSADKISPLLPGSEVPSVELQRLDGTVFDLFQEVTSRRSILIFYRGSW
jgi:hypothetical protein